MPIEQTVFSQVMSFLPMNAFRRCVARYDGNRKVTKFTCLDQFPCLAFAQLTYRESLRDIETCLRVMKPKLYHMGFREHISRGTLADANENRDWRIYADLAQILIAQARPLYQFEKLGVELDNTAMEKKLILQSLSVTRGNKKRAAELLGLKQTTFLEKMKRLDIQDEETESETE